MNMKKLSAVLIALVLAFSLSTVAFATEPTGSITVQDGSNNTKASSTYNAYQIVDWNASAKVATPNNYVYTDMTLNPAYHDALATVFENISGSGITTGSTDSQILAYLSGVASDAAGVNSSTMQQLAMALKNVADTQDPTAASTDGAFSGLPYGYYLVVETANGTNDGTVLSKPILVCLPDTTGDSSINVHAKTSQATIVKTIVNPTITSIDNDVTAAALGDTVNFQTVSTIPTYRIGTTGITYSVADELPTGLTYTAGSLTVTVNGSTLAADTDYTLNTDNHTLTVTLLHSESIQTWGNAGYSVQIHYAATVNGSATVGTVPNVSNATLTYTNYGDQTRTTSDSASVFVNSLTVTKIGDNDTGTKLGGATFDLYKEITTNVEGNSSTGWVKIDTQTTGSASETLGLATFVGNLGVGNYKLIETQAPSGYNLLKDDILFTVSATYDSQSGIVWSSTGGISVSGGTLATTISNTSGILLPGTGGAGTVLFTVGGIAILVSAGAFLFLNRKRVFGE